VETVAAVAEEEDKIKYANVPICKYANEAIGDKKIKVLDV
jgi:hypothetical protein